MKTHILCLALLFLFAGQALGEDRVKETLPTSEYFHSDNKKEQEVLHAWRLYFKGWGMENPPLARIKNLREYAKYVVKWTEHYETHEGNFGGRLLPWKDNHLLVAVIIHRETGIIPTKRGKLRGEVGLMQVHGKALDGFGKLEVRDNPELGIRLGIQWLAYSTTRCDKTKNLTKALVWSVSQYGAGSKAGKGKNCESHSYARTRIRIAKRYRRLLNRMNL